MKFPKPFYLFVLSLYLSISSTFALTPEVADLVHNETKANAVSTRSDKAVQIYNYEIPLKVLDSDISARIPADVKAALIFEKNGEKFVRWIINPEDTKWHLEMEKFLESKGLSIERHKFFTGYQTASRSYIVEVPGTSTQFSLKVSTNKTGGNWTDKKQEASDAMDVRHSTDHVMKQGPFKNFVVMDEPAAFGAKEIDQGMLARMLADLPTSNKHYLSGFSAMHETRGAEIARLNGAENPAKFWNEHYNKPLAKALAELAAKTGIAFDSPHSQNFLIELDKDMKPTGKMILRDLGDVYITTEIAEALGNKALVESWPTENISKGYIKAGVGIMHGNTMPSWLTEAQYTQWGKEFYAEYNKEFSKITGIPESVIAGHGHSQNMRYFNQNVSVNTPEFKAYLAQMKQASNSRNLERPVSRTRSPFANKCANAFL